MKASLPSARCYPLWRPCSTQMDSVPQLCCPQSTCRLVCGRKVTDGMKNCPSPSRWIGTKPRTDGQTMRFCCQEDASCWKAEPPSSSMPSLMRLGPVWAIRYMRGIRRLARLDFFLPGLWSFQRACNQSPRRKIRQRQGGFPFPDWKFRRFTCWRGRSIAFEKLSRSTYLRYYCGRIPPRQFNGFKRSTMERRSYEIG